MKKAKMERLVLLLLSAFMPFTLFAQAAGGDAGSGSHEADSVGLSEIVVTATRINNKDGSLRLIPAKEQKKASANGYGLLSKLALPYVTVNEVTREISVPPNLGQIQIRINDVVAKRGDLMSLDVESVKYVDFIQNPGLRYGKDVDFVINIVVRKPDNGYSLGAELMQTLTAMRSSGSAFAKYNAGKSGFGLNYSFGYVDLKKQRYEETADYLMPDNSVYTVERRDIDRRKKTFGHDLSLQYNLVDSARYVLQATVDGSLTRVPTDFSRRLVDYGGTSETLSVNSSDDTKSVGMDLYFNYALAERQSLTANLTGSYVNSGYNYSYGGSSPYAYRSRGDNNLLCGELIYENRLRSFTLSSGLELLRAYSSTEYEGSVDAGNSILRSNVYAFVQAKGQLGALSYMLGTGVSLQHYRQASHQYDYWLWRPQLQVSYSPLRFFNVSYAVEMTCKPPRLEYLGDVAVRNNEMEVTVGNPMLRANKVVEQSVTCSLQFPSFYTQFVTYYRSNFDCSMSQIDRVAGDDGRTYFLFTRTNQRRINLFYVNNYTRYDVLPGRLSLMFNGGLYRCFNYGNDYKHHSSAFNWGANADLYFGKLSFTVHADNGWNFLEGETKVRQAFAYYLTASYKFGDFSVSLFWQHCFQDNVKMHQGELLNRYVHKMQRIYSGDAGNMISISFGWRLSKGRKRGNIKANTMKRDRETGIIRN